MKNAIILILAAILILIYLRSSKSDETTDLKYVQYISSPVRADINISFFQDCTGSIKKNGVEIITSQNFTPYFEDVCRNIQLSFGVITANTAQKLITLELPKIQFAKPIQPDISSLPITSQKQAKREFTVALYTYREDSTRYYADRQKRCAAFSQQVDTLLHKYRQKLSDTTDLVPAFKIADKGFNFFFAGHAKNYLLINGDGLDSYNRVPEKMKNPTAFILVNSDGLPTTPIDSLATRILLSTQQAIQYTLSQTN